MADGLVLDFDGELAVIRMNNGENRFQLSTIDSWNKILDAVLSKDSVKALLISGSERFFSNGIDLTWMAQQTGDTTRIFITGLTQLLKRILVLPIPTAAVVNGHAFGGGAFLALVCDFRVMRPDKGWLCWPETALGMRFANDLLNLARTKIAPGILQREALLLAKRLTGNEAKGLGLVDSVVEEHRMVDEAKRLIRGALGKTGIDRKALGMMKKDIYGIFVDVSKL